MCIEAVMFATHVPSLQEVSISHALVFNTPEYGMENTVKKYLNQSGLGEISVLQLEEVADSVA
ncbi:MAG: hypothetical protein V4613_02350 [Bacteroidota bacterium]